MLTLEDSAHDIVGRELDEGEELIWVGRPRQGFILRGIEAFLIPLTLLWCGFAILWAVTAIQWHESWFNQAFGLAFVMVGLYFAFGRFWVDTRLRARAIYAITSERVMIRSGLWSLRVKSLRLDDLSSVSLHERGDGSGTITFGPLAQFYGWNLAAGWPDMTGAKVPSFDLLDNARRVFEIIDKAKHKAGSKTLPAHEAAPMGDPRLGPGIEGP